MGVAPKCCRRNAGKTVNRPNRTAKLQVKTAKIRIREMDINVVSAEETGTNDEKLSWLLLTTEPINTLQDPLIFIQQDGG